MTSREPYGRPLPAGGLGGDRHPHAEPAARRDDPSALRLVVGVASGAFAGAAATEIQVPALPGLAVMAVDGPDTLLATMEAYQPDAVLLLEDDGAPRLLSMMMEVRRRWPTVRVVLAVRPDEISRTRRIQIPGVAVIQLPLDPNEARVALGLPEPPVLPNFRQTQPTPPPSTPPVEIPSAQLTPAQLTPTPPDPPRPTTPAAPPPIATPHWPGGEPVRRPAPRGQRATPAPLPALRRTSDGHSGSLVPSRPTLASARIVVLAGAKGGVGATTVAVQLAVLVTRQARRVCLVDLDVRTGGIAAQLGLDHSRDLTVLAAGADIAEVSGQKLQAALSPHPAGFQVLLAPNLAERASEITALAARRILLALRARFDVVIVDVGSQSLELGALAVGLADTTLIVSTPDMPALQGAQRLVGFWRRQGLDPKAPVSVVLNRVRRDQEVQPRFVREVLVRELACARAAIPANFLALQAAVNHADPGAVSDRGYLNALAELGREVGLPLPAPVGRRRRPNRRLPRPSGARWRRDAGQAALETVAIMPLVLFVALLLWQLLLAGFTWELAGRAADQAGRRLEVAETDSGIRAAALDGLPGGWRRGASLSVDRPDSTVTVTLRTPLLAPGLASLPLTFTARQTVPREDGLGAAP